MMKILDKLAVAIIVVCYAIAFGACSSEDEPNNGLDGTVDDSFFSAFMTGKGSEVYTQTAYDVYEMDYEDYDAGSETWNDFEVWGYVFYGKGVPFVCHEGALHAPLPRYNMNKTFPNNACLINAPWDLYCKLTGFDKAVYINCDTKLSILENTMTICGYTFNVDTASGNHLVISHVGFGMQHKNGEWVPVSAIKTILDYTKREAKKSEIEKIAFFGLEKEARLKMVGMMRDYFGDVLDWTKYDESSSEKPINLKLMEDDIRNGYDDDYSYMRYTYPDKEFYD